MREIHQTGSTWDMILNSKEEEKQKSKPEKGKEEKKQNTHSEWMGEGKKHQCKIDKLWK